MRSAVNDTEHRGKVGTMNNGEKADRMRLAREYARLERECAPNLIKLAPYLDEARIPLPTSFGKLVSSGPDFTMRRRRASYFGRGLNERPSVRYRVSPSPKLNVFGVPDVERCSSLLINLQHAIEPDVASAVAIDRGGVLIRLLNWFQQDEGAPIDASRPNGPRRNAGWPRRRLRFRLQPPDLAIERDARGPPRQPRSQQGAVVHKPSCGSCLAFDLEFACTRCVVEIRVVVPKLTDIRVRTRIIEQRGR
jgi:hypothetical protein